MVEQNLVGIKVVVYAVTHSTWRRADFIDSAAKLIGYVTVTTTLERSKNECQINHHSMLSARFGAVVASFVA